jgi:hypothetical protein
MSILGSKPREGRLHSAPRFNPMPQSPSPTIVSYFVTSGSTEMSLFNAVISVDFASFESTAERQYLHRHDSWGVYL